MHNKEIESFIAVADAGSFSKAAERLYISHTAVIKQMNALEHQLGFPLFVRNKKGVTLTPAGESYYQDALKMIQLSQQALARAKEQFQKSQTTIRIGTTLLYPCTDFMNIWTKISHLLPQYQLIVVNIDPNRHFHSLIGKEFDIAIGSHDDVQNRPFSPVYPLGVFEMAIAVPFNHPLAKKQTILLSDLAQGHYRLNTIKAGYSPILDNIREIILRHYPDITLCDIADKYNLDSLNYAASAPENEVTLSHMHWKFVHPSLVHIPLEIPQAIPYGLISAVNPSETVTTFLQLLTKALKRTNK